VKLKKLLRKFILPVLRLPAQASFPTFGEFPMNGTNESSIPRAVDLAGAIAAFQRLSREAYSLDTHSFVGLFLSQITYLLSQVQRGRTVDELEWLESLEAARLVSQMDKGGPHA
jgi:hypothetical protein